MPTAVVIGAGVSAAGALTGALLVAIGGLSATEGSARVMSGAVLMGGVGAISTPGLGADRV